MAGISRQFVFGYDPDHNAITNTYSWASVPDLNSDGKLISCCFCPRTKGTEINVLQETVLFGTLGALLTFQTFSNSIHQDNGSNYSCEVITQRLDPDRVDGEAPLQKRFLQVEFTAQNPLAEGCAVSYCGDVQDPLGANVTWTPLTYTTSDTRAGIPSGLARWIHLRFVYSNNQSLKPIIGPFVLHYYKLYSREDS